MVEAYQFTWQSGVTERQIAHPKQTQPPQEEPEEWEAETFESPQDLYKKSRIRDPLKRDGG